MRFLTVTALMQYGQKLYDRGDFNGASSVFNHVLTFDAHQARALAYLKEMGQAPVSNPGPLPKTLAVQKPDPGQNLIVIKKTNEQIVDSVDVSDMDSLKAAISAKKRTIEKLRAQIIQMRESLSSPQSK